MWTVLEFRGHMVTISYSHSQQIYVTGRKRIHITWFDFVSPSTFLISHSNGEVALLDRDCGRKTIKRYSCHHTTIKTVSMHPVKNVFVTCDNQGLIRLWDLRMQRKTPVVEILHNRRLHSAYFSPVTGNSLLTTSLDDTICIYDSTTLTQDIKLKAMVNQGNFSCHRTETFKATWLPNSDDMFSVDNRQGQQKSIQIYDKDINLYYNMKHYNLTTVTSVHRFHPYRSVLAGGNACGKLFVFT